MPQRIHAPRLNYWFLGLGTRLSTTGCQFSVREDKNTPSEQNTLYLTGFFPLESGNSDISNSKQLGSERALCWTLELMQVLYTSGTAHLQHSAPRTDIILHISRLTQLTVLKKIP